MNFNNEILEAKVKHVVSSILACRIIDVNVDTKLSYLGMITKNNKAHSNAQKCI